MTHGTSTSRTDAVILAALARGDLTADPTTGHVTRRGKPVGRPYSGGYISFTFENVTMRAHRVVWLAHRNPIPAGWHVNHRNHRPWDNRLANLELVTPQGNSLHRFGQDYAAVGDGDDANVVDPEWFARVQSLAAQPDATAADIAALKTDATDRDTNGYVDRQLSKRGIRRHL